MSLGPHSGAPASGRCLPNLCRVADMQDPAFDIDLRQLEATGFRDPQAVTEQQEQQAAVAVNGQHQLATGCFQ